MKIYLVHNTNDAESYPRRYWIDSAYSKYEDAVKRFELVKKANGNRWAYTRIEEIELDVVKVDDDLKNVRVDK